MQKLSPNVTEQIYRDQAAKESLATNVLVHVMRKHNGELSVSKDNPHFFMGARLATYANGNEIRFGEHLLPRRPRI